MGISLLRYHVARSRRGASDGGGRGGRGGRQRSGLVAPSRQVGFWEVGAVHGLADEVQYAPQVPIYHVTDTASLIGCAPRDAAEVLSTLRSGELSPEWEWSTLPVASEQGLNDGSAASQVTARVRVFS